MTIFLDNFALTWDLGVIAFLFFAAFFYGFSVGVRKLGSFLLSVYFGNVIFTLFPYLDKFVGVMPDYRKAIVELAVFGILVFGIFFLTVGSVIGSSLGLPKKDESQLWQLLLLGIGSAGFFIATALAILPETYYDKLSYITKQGFILHNAHLWWATAGIAVLAILRRAKRE